MNDSAVASPLWGGLKGKTGTSTFLGVKILEKDTHPVLPAACIVNKQLGCLQAASSQNRNKCYTIEVK